MDLIINFLNKFIEINLPAINREIPDYINKKGLDPMDNIYFTETLGSIDCFNAAKKKAEKVDVKAKYTVSNCRGLSSLLISCFKIMSVENKDAPDPGYLPYAIDGRVQIKVKLSKNITADIKDLCIYAECPSVPNFKSSGTITASNVTATARSLLEIRIKDKEDAQICIKSYISDLKVDYVSLDVKINEAGKLNPVLKPFEDVLLNLLKPRIKSKIEDNTKLAVEKILSEYLPLCVGLPKPKA